MQVHAVCTCNLHGTIITDKDVSNLVGKTLTQSEKYEALKSITVPPKDYSFLFGSSKQEQEYADGVYQNGILQYCIHTLILYYYIVHYTGASYIVG